MSFSINSVKGKRSLFSPSPSEPQRNVLQKSVNQLPLPDLSGFSTPTKTSNYAQGIFSTSNNSPLPMPDLSAFSPTLTDSPFSTNSSFFSPSKNNIVISTSKRYICPETPCVSKNIKRVKLQNFIDQQKQEPIGSQIGGGDYFSVYNYGDQSVIKFALREKDSHFVLEEHNYNSYLNDLNLIIPVEPTQFKMVAGKPCMIQRKADRMFDLEDMNQVKTVIQVSEEGKVNVDVQVRKDVKNQIREMFDFCYRNNLSIDLKPKNLAWFGDELKLIDVTPCNNLSIDLPSLVETFSEGNPKLSQYFMPKDFSIKM